MNYRSEVLRTLALLSGVAVATSAFAAAPTVQVLRINSVLWGENATLHAEVADTDGNLASVKFYVQGPGISGEQYLGSAPVSGSTGVVDYAWAPPSTGYYTVRAEALDGTTGPSVSKIFESFMERRTYGPVTLQNGQGILVQADGEIVTQQNNSAPSVVAQSGSTMILWAKSRITLKPGFRANSGSFLWAAVDRDMDGYSDVEEATDSDGDGMPDAWEIDHSLSPFNAADASVDTDGDGASNLSEYQSGRNPRDRSDGPGLPSGYQLVLKTPSNTYYGLNTTTWALGTVANP